jgi:acyl-CoA synthetase (AMP-forming)/AMP-acid ligase II
MTNLYVWLKFFHLSGLTAFLFVHGVSGGASLALRSPVSRESRRLLWLSQRSGIIANLSLLVVIVTEYGCRSRDTGGARAGSGRRSWS